MNILFAVKRKERLTESPKVLSESQKSVSHYMSTLSRWLVMEMGTKTISCEV